MSRTYNINARHNEDALPQLMDRETDRLASKGLDSSRAGFGTKRFNVETGEYVNGGTAPVLPPNKASIGSRLKRKAEKGVKFEHWYARFGR